MITASRLTCEITSPVSVITVVVEVAVEDSTMATMAIGRILNSRNAVVTRSSCAG